MSQTVAARAAALLQQLVGEPADVIWSAPGRVNLIGEHTDYNDGFVLPFAIPQRAAAAVRARADGAIRVVSTLGGDPVEVPLAALAEMFPTAGALTVPEWAAYPLGVAWALRELGVPGSGVDIALASDVPIGAGLSSSAAIEGATAAALNELWGGRRQPAELAAVGRRAENEAVGAPTGIMDQMAAMLGTAGHALFLDCRSLAHEPVPFDVEAAGLAVLVIDTRVKHAHSTGGYGERRAECERGAAALGVPALRDVQVAELGRASSVLDDVTLRRVRHIVTEDQRVLDTVELLRAEGPRAVGELLTASHASMRDDFEISVPELDAAVDAALHAGALGARMTGGGFGGAAIALVEADALSEVAAAVRAAFARAGFGAPSLFPVLPARGPAREHPATVA